MRETICWLARYRAIEGRWRERPRLLFDGELEARLGRPAERALSGPELALLGDLLGPGATVLVRDEGAIRGWSRAWPQARFVPLDEAAGVCREPWAFCLIALDGAAGRELPEVAMRELLEQIADQARAGRRVFALALRGPASGGYDEQTAREIVEAWIPGPNLLAITTPAIASVIDLDALGDDEAFAVDVDNSAAAEELTVDRWLAVSVRSPQLAPLTLLEFDVPRPEPASDHERERLLLAELTEARKRADVLAIENVRLVEQLDAQSAGPVGGGDAVADRLEAALAREQALRWELSRLEAQLDQVKARPVEVLEAQVAALRAELAATRAHGGPSGGDEHRAGDSTASAVGPAAAVWAEPSDAPDASEPARSAQDRQPAAGAEAAAGPAEGLSPSSAQAGGTERAAEAGEERPEDDVDAGPAGRTELVEEGQTASRAPGPDDGSQADGAVGDEEGASGRYAVQADEAPDPGPSDLGWLGRGLLSQLDRLIRR